MKISEERIRKEIQRLGARGYTPREIHEQLIAWADEGNWELQGTAGLSRTRRNRKLKLLIKENLSFLEKVRYYVTGTRLPGTSLDERAEIPTGEGTRVQERAQRARADPGQAEIGGSGGGGGGSGESLLSPTFLFSTGFPVFALAAAYVLPLSLGGIGGGFPRWILIPGIVAALAALYGWRGVGSGWLSREWRNIVGVTALLFLILDIFSIVVNVRFDPSSMVSLTGLFYVVVLALTWFVLSTIGITQLLGWIAGGLFGPESRRDEEYELFFFLTVAGLAIGGLSSLFSVFGWLIGASINPWPYLAFMFALFGPASVYHLAHRKLSRGGETALVYAGSSGSGSQETSMVAGEAEIESVIDRMDSIASSGRMQESVNRARAMLERQGDRSGAVLQLENILSDHHDHILDEIGAGGFEELERKVERLRGGS